MKLSNTTYDRLKWFALVFIPAFEFLILSLGDIWSFAHYVEIGQTIAAIGVFLAALLGVSSKNYYKGIGIPEAEIEETEEDEIDYIQDEQEAENGN